MRIDDIVVFVHPNAEGDIGIVLEGGAFGLAFSIVLVRDGALLCSDKYIKKIGVL